MVTRERQHPDARRPEIHAIGTYTITPSAARVDTPPTAGAIALPNATAAMSAANTPVVLA